MFVKRFKAIHALLGIPLLAAALHAEGQSVGWIGPGNGFPWHSVPLGQPYALPKVAYQDSTLRDNSPTTVHIEVIGGCGTFSGAESMDVTVFRDSDFPMWTGPTPAFAPTHSGVCKLRASRGQRGQAGYFFSEADLTVYDPATLRVIPKYPVVAGSGGQGADGAFPVVVDASGSPAAYQDVRLASPDACTTVHGYEYDRVLQSYYEGQTYFQVGANGPPRRCRLVATLVRNGRTTSFDVVIYDPASARVETTPASSYTGETFSAKARLADSEGNPLPRVRFSARGSSALNGAGVESSVQYGRTDAEGLIDVQLFANGTAGYYEVIVGTSGREGRIPVAQSKRGQGMPSVPRAPAQPLTDMWWGGATQNGWGLSLVQHRDAVFGVLYAYSESGKPTWTVMPQLAWNADRTRLGGSAYATGATPYWQYDAARLKAVRTYDNLTLIFDGEGAAAMEYGEPHAGLFSRKSITRQAFGMGTSPIQGLGDMWWGGPSQNGWGLSIIQRAGELFAVWFTYDKAGEPIWYVMPSGSWQGNTWQGRMYATRGGPLDRYNAGDLRSVDVGPYSIRFESDGSATFTYSVADSFWDSANPTPRTGTLQLQRQSF